MLGKQNKPVAVCTECRRYTCNASLINQPCGNRIGNKKCKGCWGSALCDTDWVECPSCQATGYVNQKKCTQCDGYGWIYIRQS